MSNRWEKIVWVLVMVVTLSGTLAGANIFMAKKAAPVAPQAQSIQVAEGSFIPSAGNDQIKAQRQTVSYAYYYRTYKGWIQRRKWNRTYARWEGPWQNVQKAK